MKRGIRRWLAVPGLALAMGTMAACHPTPPWHPGGDGPQSTHLNQIQVVGSHNSYHELAPESERAVRRAVAGGAEDSLEYNHVPLPEQFEDQKVRQIELDAFVDTNGGLYANPLLRAATGGGPYDPAMDQPGIKVFHIQDIDYHSTCLTLIACLQQVKSWSDANKAHVPIAILLELKDTPLILGNIQFVQPEPWTAAAMDDLDAEIRSVFPEKQMITPDDVRGRSATLEDAVLTKGWPTLASSRGKVMFLMDNEGSYRDSYTAGHPSLEGRVLFTNSDPGRPDAAFLKRNDPTDPAIPGLVKKGYVVRTRSDADTVQARTNDTTDRDAALASGAQWVSTDYPVPDYGVGFETDFYVQIPGGTVARCNPVNAPRSCRSDLLDLASRPPGRP
jgi:hypothetical protein